MFAISKLVAFLGDILRKIKIYYIIFDKYLYRMDFI
jgi:hypothetical protein